MKREDGQSAGRHAAGWMKREEEREREREISCFSFLLFRFDPLLSLPPPSPPLSFSLSLSLLFALRFFLLLFLLLRNGPREDHFLFCLFSKFVGRFYCRRARETGRRGRGRGRVSLWEQRSDQRSFRRGRGKGGRRFIN